MLSAFDAIISGRVQMVMFRDFTMRRARELHIVGEVENMPDLPAPPGSLRQAGGTVRVHAEGEKENLEKLLTLLQNGPLLARVDDIGVSWLKPTGRFDRFSILY